MREPCRHPERRASRCGVLAGGPPGPSAGTERVARGSGRRGQWVMGRGRTRRSHDVQVLTMAFSREKEHQRGEKTCSKTLIMRRDE